MMYAAFGNFASKMTQVIGFVNIDRIRRYLIHNRIYRLLAARADLSEARVLEGPRRELLLPHLTGHGVESRRTSRPGALPDVQLHCAIQEHALLQKTLRDHFCEALHHQVSRPRILVQNPQQRFTLDLEQLAGFESDDRSNAA